MRNVRFWIPAIIGIVLTPIAILAALVSTGAGHGSYEAAIVLYPLSMVILVWFAGVAGEVIETISMVLVFGLAILQFPLYGFPEDRPLQKCEFVPYLLE